MPDATTTNPAHDLKALSRQMQHAREQTEAQNQSDKDRAKLRWIANHTAACLHYLASTAPAGDHIPGALDSPLLHSQSDDALLPVEDIADNLFRSAMSLQEPEGFRTVFALSADAKRIIDELPGQVDLGTDPASSAGRHYLTEYAKFLAAGEPDSDD